MDGVNEILVGAKNFDLRVYDAKWKQLGLARKAVVHGSLGLEAVDVTYCQFGAPHRKPTTIWTNCKELIDAAAPGLFFCGGAYKCPNWRNHVHVEGADASESSEFPEPFCTWMGAHINTEADRRAALRDN